jgi:hypothetical protein
VVLKNADEAAAAAENYLCEKFDAPEGNIEVSRIEFDGDFFEVSGHWESSDGRVDYKVKIDREGNVVGWIMSP